MHFENYILRDDRVGRVFRDALVRKAKEGVEVRVLYDWMGSWATGRRYWKPFKEAGVEVRAFNPPSIRNPFGVLQRDHRKMVCVDGAVAFIGDGINDAPALAAEAASRASRRMSMCSRRLSAVVADLMLRW